MDPVTMLVAAVIWQGGRPNFPQQGGGGGPEEALATMIQLVIQLLIAIPTIAGMWGVFAKAGKPGWAAIIPIYNIIVLLEIADKPVWWFILFCCPIVNIVIQLLVFMEVSQKFGQGAGFGIGLLCLPFVFWPILGFGSAEYMGGSSGRRRRREYDEGDEDEDDAPRRRR
jgi:hypothetical protein